MWSYFLLVTTKQSQNQIKLNQKKEKEEDPHIFLFVISFYWGTRGQCFINANLLFAHHYNKAGTDIHLALE